MKHFTHSFTHTKLASAVTFALMSLHATSPVYAQQANEQDVEVINVKGVRGALVSAANIKRDSDGVVDAITAQDIGKFPDTNLAESLHVGRCSNRHTADCLGGWQRDVVHQ